MKQNLLKEMETGSKNALLKKRIITHYIYNGSSTITDLAKELDLSVPTTTKFINETVINSDHRYNLTFKYIKNGCFSFRKKQPFF